MAVAPAQQLKVNLKLDSAPFLEKVERAKSEVKKLSRQARETTRAIAELEAFCNEHGIDFKIEQS